jgi:hypothetical protein
MMLFTFTSGYSVYYELNYLKRISRCCGKQVDALFINVKLMKKLFIRFDNYELNKMYQEVKRLSDIIIAHYVIKNITRIQGSRML